MNALVAYLVAAMLAWAPAKDQAPDPPELTRSRYEAIATDAATVALDPDEPSPFPNDEARAHSALALVGLAFFESHFWRFVDDGRCNDRAWRRVHAKKGSPNESVCDGSLAFSLWQIHTDYGSANGIVLVGDDWKHDPHGLVGRDLLDDRKLAARVALHMLRRSTRAHGSWCGYTGESALGGCPKAKLRKEFVARYLREHPFEAEP